MKDYQKVLGLFLLFLLSLPLNAQKDQELDMAKEQARLDATRNLVERILGVWLVSETEIKDFKTNKDVVIAKTQGSLFGVRYSEHLIENGILSLNAQISGEDALSAIRQSTKYKGGGELPDKIIATGQAAISGSTVSSSKFTRLYSVDSVVAGVIWDQLGLRAKPSESAWVSFVKSLQFGSIITIIDDKGTIRVEYELQIADIEFAIEDARFDSYTQSEAKRKAKERFGAGIYTSFSVKGNKISFPRKEKEGYFDCYFNPFYDVALALSEQTGQHPNYDLIEASQKYTSVKSSYSSSKKTLSLTFSLSRSNVEELLEEADFDKSDVILQKIGQGVELSADVIQKK